MNKFKFSIIIPVYNVEKYLEKCIESIMRQIDEHDEVILVDDGSKDSSFSICQKAQKTYRNITLIHTENRGVSAARNSALALAQGEYVSFMDSDDYWIENTFQHIKQEILKHKECEVFMADYKKLDEPTGKIIDMDQDRAYKTEKPTRGKDFIIGLLKVNNHIYISVFRFIVKRETLIKHQIKFEDGLYYEDVMWEFQVLMTVDRVLYIPCYFYVYRTNRENQITGSLSLKKILDRIKISAYWLNEAPKHFQDKEALDLFIRRSSELYFTSVVSFRSLRNPQDEQIILDELIKHKELLSYPNYPRYKWVANTCHIFGIGFASTLYYRLNQFKHKVK